jgi:hypothetical protein
MSLTRNSNRSKHLRVFVPLSILLILIVSLAFGMSAGFYRDLIRCLPVLPIRSCARNIAQLVICADGGFFYFFSGLREKLLRR